MNKRIVYLITLIVCILLQLGIAPHIAIGGATPNFLLLPVLLISLYSGVAVGSLTGFLLGILQDLATDGAIGCMALIFVIVAVCVGAISTNLETKTALLACILVVVSSFFMEIAYGFIYVLSNAQSTGILATFVGNSLPSAVYTAVIGCIGLVSMIFVTADDAPQANVFINGRKGGGYSLPTKYK